MDEQNLFRALIGAAWVALMPIMIYHRSANAFVPAGGVLAFALVVSRTRREEDRLVARSGEHYTRDMRQTGRFVPGRGRA